jgi:hypothetical protein
MAHTALVAAIFYSCRFGQRRIEQIRTSFLLSDELFNIRMLFLSIGRDAMYALSLPLEITQKHLAVVMFFWSAIVNCVHNCQLMSKDGGAGKL